MKEINIKVSTREDRTKLIMDAEAAVLKAWERRRFAQGWPKNHKTTRKTQSEYLMGMVATMDFILNAEETKESSISPHVMFSIMRGDYIEPLK